MSNQRTPHRGGWRVVLAMSLSVAAACGGSSETVLDAPAGSVATTDEPAPVTAAPTSSAAATTTTPTVAAPILTEPEGGEVTTTDGEPVVEPFPAPALPILEVHLMDQPVWSPIGFDDELVFGHGMGIGRLDLTDGTVTTKPLATDDEPKAELFYAVSDGETFVGIADVAGQGTVDKVIAIDPDTLGFTAVLESTPPEKVLPGPASGPAPRIVVASSPDGPRFIDAQDLGLGEPVAFVDPSATIHTNRGELWTWTPDGLVQVYDAGGELIGTVETGLPVGPFGGAATLVTPTSMWIMQTSTAQLVRIDRADMEVTHSLDLKEHFSWADAVRLRQTNTTDRFLLANAVAGDEGWWLLVEVDPETGVVVSEHVLATDAFEYGWNAFDGPEIATVGDRLFIRDHRRRLVEVDVAALGRPSALAWSDPGLGRAPVLSAEEQEIADLAVQMVNGDFTPGFTDPVLGPEILEYSATLRTAGTWDIYGAEVVGDRAAVRAGPIGDGVGAYFVFRRVDSEWLFDVNELCALVAQSGPCAPA